jgi:NADPH:quinone reductase-like Zn-dependent oxidoreductase
VIVRVPAAGVNRSEALACRGIIPGPFPRPVGREFAAVVIAAGDKRHTDPAGRRVGGCGGGGLGFATDGAQGELVRVDRDAVVETPESMSDVEAGASASACFTASAALDRAGGVTPGSTVLVTGAAGAVGAAAAALARRDGARVVGIVPNHEESTLLNDDIDIASASDAPDLADLLRNHAQGARTLVDTVGGQLLADLLPVLGTGAGACILSAPSTAA